MSAEITRKSKYGRFGMYAGAFIIIVHIFCLIVLIRSAGTGYMLADIVFVIGSLFAGFCGFHLILARESHAEAFVREVTEVIGDYTIANQEMEGENDTSEI